MQTQYIILIHCYHFSIYIVYNNFVRKCTKKQNSPIQSILNFTNFISQNNYTLKKYAFFIFDTIISNIFSKKSNVL